jgi:Domain of unknown function (DUF4383)
MSVATTLSFLRDPRGRGSAGETMIYDGVFVVQGVPETEHTGGAWMEERSPAQIYALVVGVTLVAAGILGFFYSASFGTGDGTGRDAVLGILDVNGWHNLVHLATGALGLALAASYGGARGYALGLGVVYLVVALLGFIVGDGDEIVNLIPVNTEDNVLHLLLGVGGVGAALATPAERASSPVRPAAA